MLFIFVSSTEIEIGIENWLDGQIIVSWIWYWIWNRHRELNLWSVNHLRFQKWNLKLATRINKLIGWSGYGKWRFWKAKIRTEFWRHFIEEQRIRLYRFQYWGNSMWMEPCEKKNTWKEKWSYTATAEDTPAEVINMPEALPISWRSILPWMSLVLIIDWHRSIRIRQHWKMPWKYGIIWCITVMVRQMWSL